MNKQSNNASPSQQDLKNLQADEEKALNMQYAALKRAARGGLLPENFLVTENRDGKKCLNVMDPLLVKLSKAGYNIYDLEDIILLNQKTQKYKKDLEDIVAWRVEGMTMPPRGYKYGEKVLKSTMYKNAVHDYENHALPLRRMHLEAYFNGHPYVNHDWSTNHRPFTDIDPVVDYGFCKGLYEEAKRLEISLPQKLQDAVSKENITLYVQYRLDGYEKAIQMSRKVYSDLVAFAVENELSEDLIRDIQSAGEKRDDLGRKQKS